MHVETLMPVFINNTSRAFKNSPELSIESIRLKFLVIMHHCTNYDLNLKTLIHRHHGQQNECFIRAFTSYEYRKDVTDSLSVKRTEYNHICVKYQ